MLALVHVGGVVNVVRAGEAKGSVLHPPKVGLQVGFDGVDEWGQLHLGEPDARGEWTKGAGGGFDAEWEAALSRTVAVGWAIVPPAQNNDWVTRIGGAWRHGSRGGRGWGHFLAVCPFLFLRGGELVVIRLGRAGVAPRRQTEPGFGEGGGRIVDSEWNGACWVPWVDCNARCACLAKHLRGT